MRWEVPLRARVSIVKLPRMSKKSGGRGRDRTYDQSIKSRMLYQLSYASFGFAPGREVGVRAFARFVNKQDCDH